MSLEFAGQLDGSRAPIPNCVTPSSHSTQSQLLNAFTFSIPQIPWAPGGHPHSADHNFSNHDFLPLLQSVSVFQPSTVSTLYNLTPLSFKLSCTFQMYTEQPHIIITISLHVYQNHHIPPHHRAP